MRKCILLIMLVCLMATPVYAAELTAPTVPESAREFMPSNQETFGQGLLEVLQDALVYFRPDLKEASGVCLGITAAIMIVSVIRSFPGAAQKAADLAGTVIVAILLLDAANSMIRLGTETVSEISEYGKLLLPVMTTAMAAQGSVTTSAALYTGTAAFNAVMSSLIAKLLTPMIYFYLSLAASCAAIGDDMLKKIRDMLKAFMTWVLKTLLYIFTGYISITGVVSGSTDAAARKPPS